MKTAIALFFLVGSLSAFASAGDFEIENASEIECFEPIGTLADVGIEAQGRAPLWVCQATDYGTGFGVGRAPTREEASAQAILNCQLRSTGSCSISGCSYLP